MRKIWIYLIILPITILLTNILAYANINTVKINIFSKEAYIKSINLKSLVEIYPLKITLNEAYSFQLSSNRRNIVLLNNNNSRQILPNKFSFISKYKKPICIGVNLNLKRCYLGRIDISIKDGSIYLVNKVALQDYLNSVVSSELPINWPTEAVKAQTIAVHTYLLHNLKSNKIIKDSTQDQFYGGVEYINPKYISIIASVKDILMIDDKKNPINALYHSTCNGKTFNNDDIFGGKADKHLRSVRCLYNADSPFANSKLFRITKENLLKKLHCTEIAFLRNKDNSIYRIKLDSKLYTPYNFWIFIGSRIGWGNIPGISYNAICNNYECDFISKGAGHGVGMCQWGARGMALKGFNYKDILHHYYKNITIK